VDMLFKNCHRLVDMLSLKTVIGWWICFLKTVIGWWICFLKTVIDWWICFL
jgi:hypothetical protein